MAVWMGELGQKAPQEYKEKKKMQGSLEVRGVINPCSITTPHVAHVQHELCPPGALKCSRPPGFLRPKQDTEIAAANIRKYFICCQCCVFFFTEPLAELFNTFNENERRQNK